MPLERAEDVRQLSPAVLAFVGDATFGLYIRVRLATSQHGSSHRLHVKAISYVKAAAQAMIAREMVPLLTEEEAAVFRRGRNAKSTTVPKNANVHDYRMATGFEAVMGYLYLTGKEARLNELLNLAAEVIERDGGTKKCPNGSVETQVQESTQECGGTERIEEP